MAKNPEDRFQSAKEVSELLERCGAQLQASGNVTGVEASLVMALSEVNSATKQGSKHFKDSVATEKHALSRILFGMLLGILVLLPILFGKQLSSYMNTWIWPAIPVLPETAVAGGLEFDGKDDFVSIDAVDWSYPQFTIEAFVTSARESDNGTIVQLGSGGDKPEWMSLYDDRPADSGKRLSGAAIQGKTPFANTSAPLTAGVRQHRALVFDGRHMHYYVNGIWQAKRFAEAHEGLMWKMKNLRIACDGSERRFFQGRIDQVRISRIARYNDNFAPISSVTSDDSTLALYNFDEGNGEVLKDASGNGNNGKIVGARWAKAMDLARAEMPQGTGLEFATTESHVAVDSLIFHPEEPLTLEAWVTAERINPSGYLSLVAGFGPLDLKLTPSAGAWEFVLWNQSLKRSLADSPLAAPCQPGSIVHLCGVWNPENGLSLFVDGKRIGTAKTTLTGNALVQFARSAQDAALTPSLVIGGLRPVTNQTRGTQLTGIIHEMRVSKIVRYEQAFTPSHRWLNDPDTIALYKFDEGQGDILHDASGNGHHGKIVGAKWVKSKSGELTSNPNSPPSEILDSKSQISNSTTGWAGWPSDTPPSAIAPFNAQQAKQHQEAWANYLKVPVEYTNSIGMKFRLIPPGEFMMGAPQDEIEEMVAKNVPQNKVWEDVIRSQGPQHRVILTQPFYAGIHEVTQGQFQRVNRRQNQSSIQPESTQETNESRNVNHPVRTATWGDAINFTVQLSQLEQIPASYLATDERWIPQNSSGYQLPTEAQWEFAGRAGTTTRYWSGPAINDLLAVDWVAENSENRTHAVGEKPANPFGLFDVHGNEIEWTENEFDPTDYQKSQQTPSIDPRKLKNQGWTTFVARGGRSDNWGVQACSSAFRLPRAFGNPTTKSDIGGCRLVLSVEAVRMLSKLTGPSLE